MSEERQNVVLRLYNLRHDSKYTADAHMEKEKVLNASVKWYTNVTKVLLSSTFAPLAAHFAKDSKFKIATAFLSATGGAVTLYLQNYISDLQAEHNKVERAVELWSEYYAEMTDLQDKYMTNKVSVADFESKVDEFAVKKTKIMNSTPRTDNRMYRVAADKLNSYWYQSEAAKFTNVGWKMPSNLQADLDANKKSNI